MCNSVIHSMSRGVIDGHRRHVTVSRHRRGFSLVEMLIALAITAALLTATMVALNASFIAYQSTTEVASTHTIGRIIMHRVQAMIRTGQEFGPYPTSSLVTVITSDDMQFRDPDGNVVTLVWKQNADAGNGYPQGESLYIVITNAGVETPYLLLEGVKPQYDSAGNRIKPFTLQYAKGRTLYRATVDLLIKPDDNMSVSLDGNNDDTIRLVASAMPRMETFE
jgi:prepilin-type N-terminal cleavage/methylation domain-containing protein